MQWINAMIYLEKIKIVGSTYPGSHVLDKGFEIICSEINLFVGDQGCGKSTLLDLIQKNHSDIKLKLSEHTLKNSVQSFYFDSEKDNPRVKNPQLFTSPNGQNVGVGMSGALRSRFKSHGEVLQEFIITPILKAKDCVVILDEPESGLSITNQFKLVNAINTAVKNNCQFFIATHCYPLIESFDVISLEHKERMRGIDFINKVKNSSNDKKSKKATKIKASSKSSDCPQCNARKGESHEFGCTYEQNTTKEDICPQCNAGRNESHEFGCTYGQ